MMYGKAVQTPSYRQRTAYHTMILGGTAFITSTMIVIGNIETGPEIQRRLEEDKIRSLEAVIPPEIHSNNILKDTIQIDYKGETKTIYIAKTKNKPVAVAFEMSTQGYSGPIKVIVGISQNGDILGTRVLSHSETPGLGDKIESEKTPWILKFTGLSLQNPSESQWKVKKDGGYFDQFTGATITPRATVKAIRSGLELFNSYKTTFLTATEDTDSSTKQPAVGADNAMLEGKKHGK